MQASCIPLQYARKLSVLIWFRTPQISSDSEVSVQTNNAKIMHIQQQRNTAACEPALPIAQSGACVRLQLQQGLVVRPLQTNRWRITLSRRINTKSSIKLETKASSHEGQCIPAGYCHAHMLLYESGVNYNVNGKYTKYFAQLCVRIFTFWNISTTH